MGWFEDIILKLFGSAKSTKTKTPFLEEKLIRRGDFFFQMQDWKNKHFKKLNNLTSEPILMGLRGDSVAGIYCLKQNGVDGIFFNFDFENGDYTDNYPFWSEHATEILEKRNYYKYQAIRKIYDRGNYVETIEKTYLKQKINLNSNIPIEQNWGNISIEVSYNNDFATSLKIQRNYYFDRNYNKPRDFEELLAIIFNFPLKEDML